MANLTLEGVAVDVWGLADHLVADVLVADNGVSGLDSLQHGGRVGDGVHCRRLGNQPLAVDGSQGWNGGHRRNCCHCRRIGWN